MNVIVGKLSSDRSFPSYLLNSEVVQHTNHQTVAKVFNDSMSLLWPDGVKYEKVFLFVSDAAPYMIKCCTSLMVLYVRMTHVTCWAHGVFILIFH